MSPRVTAQAALSDHLPSSALPGILEDCLLWLEALGV